jgi:glucose-1-phosphate thymidylyltransferase
VVIDGFISTPADGSTMIGVVPAAGEGTRLRPLTEDRPKGMVEIGDRPLLAHVLDTLVATGVDELVVIVGYELSAIVDAFGDEYRGLPITYVHQRDRLGLGHAVLQAAPQIDGPAVVLNGDNVFETPPSWIDRLDLGAPGIGNAVVVVEEVSRKEARTTATVDVEPASIDGPDGTERVRGRVTSITEKPTDPTSTLVATGCHVLPESIVDALELLTPSERGEFELPDAIGVLIRAGATVLAVDTAGERVNVNTEADLRRANRLLEH